MHFSYNFKTNFKTGFYWLNGFTIRHHPTMDSRTADFKVGRPRFSSRFSHRPNSRALGAGDLSSQRSLVDFSSKGPRRGYLWENDGFRQTNWGLASTTRWKFNKLKNMDRRTGLSEHGLWARIINCFMGRMIINRILGYVLPKKSMFEVQCRLLMVKHVPFQKRLYQDYPCFVGKEGSVQSLILTFRGQYPRLYQVDPIPKKKKVPRWDPKMNRSIKYDQGSQLFGVFWRNWRKFTADIQRNEEWLRPISRNNGGTLLW